MNGKLPRCPICGMPLNRCRCGMGWNKEENKIDSSFQCFVCEMFFDNDPKESSKFLPKLRKSEKPDSSENLTNSNESSFANEDIDFIPSSLTPIASDGEEIEDCKEYKFMKNDEDEFDKCLTSFSDVIADDLKKEEEELKYKKIIDEYRWFYLKNQRSDIISLKKTVYEKYRGIMDFVGYKFTDYFKDKDVVVLLTQCVNESEEMKKIAKILFYRELHLGNYSNKHSVFSSTLFKKYIGGDEKLFIENERKLISYYRWCFLVHKRRYSYVEKLTKLEGGIVRSLKKYSDVLKYCIDNHVIVNSNIV